MAGPFPRTECACAECVKCCETQPGYLVLEDIESISEFLGEPAEPYLVASRGATLGKMTTEGLVVFQVGSITPSTTNAAGRCVFLTDDGRCRIHPAAPFGCAMFDTHQREGEFEPQQQCGIRQMMRREYQAKRATLPPAKTHNPR